jgi:nucleoid-associated protein YgaU
MQNDAKLGLVVGVGLVIVIAVVFFRREPAQADAGQAAAVAPAGQDGRPAPRNQLPAPGPVRRHVVQQGDTLYGLARRYYQDDRKFVDIYRANQDVLTTPDPLMPGTDLVIPEVP